MKKIIITIALFLLYTEISAQTIGVYGIKTGLLFSGLTSGDNSKILEDNSSIMNFLSFDAGIFLEFFNTKTFCISTELHYNIKGERNPNFVKVISQGQSNQGNTYTLNYMSDRFHYLSFQVLPRYNFVLSKTETLFLFGGPGFDYLIKNTNSDAENVLSVTSGLEFAGIAGFGASIQNRVLIEFRLQHNFTPTYSFVYGSEKVHRFNNSAILLIGYKLNSL